MLRLVGLTLATALVLSGVGLVGEAFGQDEDVHVEAKDYWFEPAYPSVPVGTTVTWTNGDMEAHTVTNDLGLFDHEIGPGETWSYTFTEPGVYFYYCQPHDWMIGEVTVVAS